MISWQCFEEGLANLRPREHAALERLNGWLPKHWFFVSTTPTLLETAS